jgi:hypothetical protein
MVLIAFFRDADSRALAYRQLIRAVANNQPFLGYQPTGFGQNGNRPCQITCHGNEIVVFPFLPGKEIPLPLEPRDLSLLEVVIADLTAARAWDLFTRYGKSGISQYAIRAQRKPTQPFIVRKTAAA